MSSAQPKWKTVTFWIMSILVTLAFLGAALPKLMGKPEMVHNFERWGYPGWFLPVTGTVETLGALMLLVPRARFYGAMMLCCTMVGAILTHLRAGEMSWLPPPIVLLTLSAILAWNHRPSRFGGRTTQPAAGA